MEANQTQTQTQTQIAVYAQMAARILESCGQQPYVHDGAVVWRDGDELDRTITFEIVSEEGEEPVTVKICRDADTVQVPPEGAALLGRIRNGWTIARPEGEWMAAVVRDDFCDFEQALKWIMGESEKEPRGLVSVRKGTAR